MVPGMAMSDPEVVEATNVAPLPMIQPQAAS